MSHSEDRLGFLLTPLQTERIAILSDYMGKTPHQLISDAIDTLWAAYRERASKDE